MIVAVDPNDIWRIELSNESRAPAHSYVGADVVLYQSISVKSVLRVAVPIELVLSMIVFKVIVVVFWKAV